MKNKNLAMLLFISAIFSLSACKKATDLSADSVVGTYKGTLTLQSELKSKLNDQSPNDSATAVVSLLDDGMMEVHCYGNNLDTTFMLNFYENNDSLMVCLSGDDFEHQYGHMMGEGHMGGGMMGDIQKGETNWMHHMSDEHDEGDVHFGGFDMMEGSFTYSFMMDENAKTSYLRFHGIKGNN